MSDQSIDFPFIRLRFTCRVTGPLLYFTTRRGETIKGLLAQEIKKLFPCPDSTTCETCTWTDDPQKCIYVHFFRNDLCPSPFAYTIIPPLTHRSVYFYNETFDFEIRLFGQCARFEYLIKYLAPAIEQGGLLSGIGTWYKEEKQHFGRFQLSGIHAWENAGWKEIFHGEKGFLVEDIAAQSFGDMISGHMPDYHQMVFYTPFYLKRSGKTIAEPTMEDMVYFSMMRLHVIHGDRTFRLDDGVYERLNEIGSKGSFFEKVLTAKHTHYYIGRLEFDRLPRDVIPILKLGSLCHIGKGITQGYGGYFLTG